MNHSKNQSSIIIALLVLIIVGIGVLVFRKGTHESQLEANVLSSNLTGAGIANPIGGTVTTPAGIMTYFADDGTCWVHFSQGEDREGVTRTGTNSDGSTFMLCGLSLVASRGTMKPVAYLPVSNSPAPSTGIYYAALKTSTPSICVAMGGQVTPGTKTSTGTYNCKLLPQQITLTLPDYLTLTGLQQGILPATGTNEALQSVQVTPATANGGNATQVLDNQ